MKKRKMRKVSPKKTRNEKIRVQRCNCRHGACGGGLYFIGFIGAAIYYIQTATSFWTGVLGFLKALVWPAFLVYELLKFLLG